MEGTHARIARGGLAWAWSQRLAWVERETLARVSVGLLHG